MANNNATRNIGSKLQVNDGTIEDMNKACLYLRYSDPKQNGGTTIQSQEKAARSASDVSGFEVVMVEKDEAVSADQTKMTNRVANLLEFCKANKGKFDVLMVYKLDRFARGQEQHHWLRGQLMKMGIVLRSATERIDESPSGKLIEGVLAAVNEYDNEVKRERVKLAMWTRVEQGLYPWQPPLGYYPEKNRPEGVKLTPHLEDKACSNEVIKIFKEFSSGEVSKQQLGKIYSKKVIRNHKGQRIKFSKQTIDGMLNNWYYCGFLKHIDGRLIQGKHKALVPADLFKRCQEVQEGKSNNTRGKKRKETVHFPLRRFAKCGHCQEALTASWQTGNGGRYPYYYCHNTKCTQHDKTIKRSDIEQSFQSYLKSVKPTEDFVKKFETRFVSKYKEREKEINWQYLHQQKVVERAEAHKAEVVRKGDKGIYDDDTLKEELAKAKQALMLEKSLLSELHDEELDVDALLTYADTFIKRLELIWLDALPEYKLRLQEYIFPEGVIYTNGNFTNHKICRFFSLIEDLAVENETNVTPPGFEPGLTG